MLAWIVVTVHVLACLVLIVIVLLQQGKGAEIGAVFGGSSQTVFGSSGAGNFLTRLTTATAIVFMATSLFLAYGTLRGPGSPSGVENIPLPPETEESGQKAAAASPAATGTAEPAATETAEPTTGSGGAATETAAAPAAGGAKKKAGTGKAGQSPKRSGGSGAAGRGGEKAAAGGGAAGPPAKAAGGTRAAAPAGEATPAKR